jgi:hypothetical protein
LANPAGAMGRNPRKRVKFDRQRDSLCASLQGDSPAAGIHMTQRLTTSHGRRSVSAFDLRWWFGAMAFVGFAFGLFGDRRPFGTGALAHPLVVYFIVVGIALLALRVALARPVPDVIPERALLFGCFAGLAAFLAGNFVTAHLPIVW